MSKGWDNAMLKKLKALTGKGLSTAEIGKKLGMSKNAVVGKLNRLGWNSKAGGAPVVQDKKAAPVKEASKASVRTAKESAVAPASKSPAKKSVASVKKATVAPKKTVEKQAADKKAGASKETKKEIKVATPRATSTKAANKTLAMHQRIIQHSLEMANLKPNQCRWPIGDPDSEHFHFCGEQVFVGKPYCYEHCKQAYQFTPPKKK